MTLLVPKVRVYFGQYYFESIQSVTYSYSKNGIGSATIVMNGFFHDVHPEDTVTIYAGYEPNPFGLVFTGFVDTVSMSLGEGATTIQCRDILKKALDTFLIQEVKFGIDVEQGRYYYSTYTGNNGGEFTIHEYTSLSDLHANHPETTDNITSEGVKAEAVVQWLLVMCGLAEGTQIQVSPSNFFIGDITPVSFQFTSVYDAIMQIAELLGWDFYATPEGVARFHPRSEYIRGRTLRYALSDIPNHDPVFESQIEVTNTDLRNYIEVVGSSGVRHVERAFSPYLGTTPYRGVYYASPFVDTPGIASYLARRMLNDLNRLKVQLSLTVPGRNDITLNNRVSVKLNTWLTSTAADQSLWSIESYQGTIDASGYIIKLQLYEYIGDVGFDDTPPPDFFPFSVFYHFTLGDPKLLVTFDASYAGNMASAVAEYKWTINGVEYPPSSEPTLTILLDRDQLITTGVLVILSLRYEGSSNWRSSEPKLITYEDITFPSGGEVYRNLFAALRTMAAYSLDSGQTWTTYPIPAISVAASHFDIRDRQPIDRQYALFGTSTGSVYRLTLDGNFTEVLTTAGEVTQVRISPSNSAVCYALVTQGSTSSIWRNPVNGKPSSWNQMGTIPGGVIHDIELILPDEVSFFITQDQEVSITYGVGRTVLYTLDPSLASLVTPAPSSLSLRSIRTAPYGNLEHIFVGVAPVGVLHTTDRFQTVDVILFPGNAQKTAVSISPDLERPILHVVADDNTLYNVYVNPGPSTGTTYTMTAAQDCSPMSLAYLVRDGLFKDILYYATYSGVYKSFDANHSVAALYLPDGTPPAQGWGVQVAYGSLGIPQEPSTLLVHGYRLDDLYPIVSGTVDTSSPLGSTPLSTLSVALIGGSPEAVTTGLAYLKHPTYATDHIVYGAVEGSALVIARVDGSPGEGDPPLPAGYTADYYRNILLHVATVPSGLPTVQPFITSYPGFMDRIKYEAALISPTQPRTALIQGVSRDGSETWTLGGHDQKFFMHVTDLAEGQSNRQWSASVPDVLEGIVGFGGGVGSRIYLDYTHPSPQYPSTKSAFSCIRGGHPFKTRVFPTFVHASSSIETVTISDNVSTNVDNDAGFTSATFDIIPLCKFNAVSLMVGAHLMYKYPSTSPQKADFDMSATPPFSPWRNPAGNAQLALVKKINANNSNEAFEVTLLSSLPRELIGGEYSPVIAAMASYQYNDVLYYATRCFLYKVPNYGQGTPEVLFEVPEEYDPRVSSDAYGISFLSVIAGSPKSGLPNQSFIDRIVFVLKKEESTSNAVGLIYFSDDGGLTWRKHAWRGYAPNSYVVGAWYL